MSKLIDSKIEEFKIKFNEVLHRMYNLEIVPEIQSRINERIPERGGFMLFQNEEIEAWLKQTLEQVEREGYEKIKQMIENDFQDGIEKTILFHRLDELKQEEE